LGEPIEFVTAPLTINQDDAISIVSLERSMIVFLERFILRNIYPLCHAMMAND